MGAPGRATQAKRQRERANQARKLEKSAEKARRKEEKKQLKDERSNSGEDPDLIGIVPGPQPINLF